MCLIDGCSELPQEAAVVLAVSSGETAPSVFQGAAQGGLKVGSAVDRALNNTPPQDRVGHK